MTVQAEKVTAEKAAAKPHEKLAEKRRALGRGLESLLPGGPRVLSLDPTLAQRTRKDGEPTSVVAGEAPALPGGSTGSEAADAIAGGTPAPHPSRTSAPGAHTTPGEPALPIELPVAQIEHNPHQTRREFDEEFLQELARSIQMQGVLQPIVVRPATDGRYVLILGERRLRASKLAGKATIPAIIKRVSEQQAAEMTIVENLQRQDLQCLEQAEAFAHLSTEFHLTQEEIGKRVGVARETVSNYLRLLRLPEKVQDYLQSGELTYSHARELLGLHDENQVVKVAEKAVKEKMSVALLDELVMDINLPLEKRGPEKPSWAGARWVDPNVRATQKQLEASLGMRVRIRDRKGKGKITIEYASLEDFDRLLELLKVKS